MQAPARNLYHKPKTVDELTERNVALVAQLDKITFIWAHVL